MTEDHLRHIEALAATLIKLDSIPHTSGYYKLASEYVPELIAEVRQLHDERTNDDLWFDESEACE